jgi:hypothetical protein
MTAQSGAIDCPHLSPQSGDFEHGLLPYTFGCFSIGEIAPSAKLGHKSAEEADAAAMEHSVSAVNDLSRLGQDVSAGQIPDLDRT